MKVVVERNMALARRGGVPSTLSLIDAYLNVKHLHNPPQNSQVISIFFANVEGLFQFFFVFIYYLV